MLSGDLDSSSLRDHVWIV